MACGRVVFVGVQRGPATALPLLFGVIAFALWLIAAHDAYREATGASSAVILKPRYFLYVVLGLLLLLLALLVLQGLEARRRAGRASSAGELAQSMTAGATTPSGPSTAHEPPL